MQLKKAVPLLALVSVGLLAFMPIVAADPINPNLVWSATNVSQNGTTTATFGVANQLPAGGNDPDCPPGDTFTGTLTVTTPGGLTSTVTETAVPCGTQNLSAVYPTAFTAGTGPASTGTLGAYSASWAGTTSATVGGFHPLFNVTDNFIVVAFSPPTQVPQFGAPLMLVAAFGLVLVAAAKKGRLFNV
jgi:hypothetical protein